MLDFSRVFAAALIAVVAMAVPARAGFISEIAIESYTHDRDGALPSYVELSAVQPGAACELIVIDARSNLNHGRILNVISLSPVLAVNVVADAAWPAVNPPTVNPLALSVTSVPLFDHGFADALSVILIDGQSNLVVGDRLRRPTDLPGGNAIFDVVTFEAGAASGKSFAGEAVLDAAGADVIARPNGPGGLPLDRYFIGPVGTFNQVMGVSPAFAVNPGMTNDIWLAPEPAASAVFALAVVLLGRRRRRTQRL